jgi:acyl-CoA thioester hydrolase
MLIEHAIEFRVRYQETDAQGVAHHANYLTWLEMGRVELMRAGGRDYKQFEADGMMIVISQVKIQYYRPARFDDLIRLTTLVVRAKGARLIHRYVLSCGDQKLAEAETQCACVNRSGGVSRIPSWMVYDGADSC